MQRGSIQKLLLIGAGVLVAIFLLLFFVSDKFMPPSSYCSDPAYKLLFQTNQTAADASEAFGILKEFVGKERLGDYNERIISSSSAEKLQAKHAAITNRSGTAYEIDGWAIADILIDRQGNIYSRLKCL